MVVIAGEPRLLGFRRKDASAEVDRLYRRHSDEVLRYALLVLRSRPDAEDVVQATWIRAFRALERGERVQKPRNWLIKITHNECRRLLATRSRRSVEVELDEIPVEPAEPGRAEALRTALSQLAPKQREALVLRELEGRSYAEIAQALEVSDSAVETLIFRARRAVREQMDGVLGCEETCALIAREELTDDERIRVRAHTRACADCATAERQARGRKSALRRIASSLFPGCWKTVFSKVAIGVGASALGVTAVAVADSQPSRLPDVMPLQVDKAEVAAAPRVAAVRREHTATRPARTVGGHPPPLRHVVSLEALRRTAAPAPGAAPVAEAPADTPAPAPVPHTPPDPAPTPTAAPRPAVPAKPVEAAMPSVAVPTVTLPEVPKLPDLPVPVPVPVPTVTTPTVSTPTVTLPIPPLPAPQVPALPGIP